MNFKADTIALAQACDLRVRNLNSRVGRPPTLTNLSPLGNWDLR